MLKKVDQPPKDGSNFIIVWQHGGQVWSDVCRFEGDAMLTFCKDNSDDNYWSAERFSYDNLELSFYVFPKGDCE